MTNRDEIVESMGLNPPHYPGGNCPRCGEEGTLDVHDGELYCSYCDGDIDPQEEPIFNPEAEYICNNPGPKGCGSCPACDDWGDHAYHAMIDENMHGDNLRDNYDYDV